MNEQRTVGSVVRQAREIRGLSVEELCRRAHLQPVVLFNIEEDLDDRPPASALFFLAKELGLDYAELLRLGGHFSHDT
ncbi:MAG TPA: helix-turn-helix transcriptional regulator [Gemmatimonadaceae bacterium]|nr:helix-turn-helix transcriptional regulator [Gemmatimonadaceae bacterium]